MLDKEAWIREFKDKKILIWGYGMEGKSSYRFIRSLLPDQVITIADKKKDAITDTVNTILLDESETNFNEYDLILKASYFTKGAYLLIKASFICGYKVFLYSIQYSFSFSLVIIILFCILFLLCLIKLFIYIITYN